MCVTDIHEPTMRTGVTVLCVGADSITTYTGARDWIPSKMS